MKAHLLISILTAATGIAGHAQSPNVPPPPGLPPGPGSAQHQGPGQQNDRREQFRKMSEQFRRHQGQGGADRQQGNPQERAAHIAEAMKHLQAAGLGRMAGHIEQMLKATNDGRGPQGPQMQRPFGPMQRPGQPSPGSAAAPAPFTPPMLRQRGPDAAKSDGSSNDLRAQVQNLTRQVEELRKLIGNRSGDHQGSPRGGEHHQSGPGRPGGGENKERRPQGDQPQARPQGGGDDQARRPQGDQPQTRPQGGGENKERRPQGDQPQRPSGDGPRRENRDAPPQPKRDGAEQIKPALIPQTGSIE